MRVRKLKNVAFGTECRRSYILDRNEVKDHRYGRTMEASSVLNGNLGALLRAALTTAPLRRGDMVLADSLGEERWAEVHGEPLVITEILGRGWYMVRSPTDREMKARADRLMRVT